jgi:hypothetical protein
MKIAPLAALLLAATPGVQAPPPSPSPIPDVTIRTRTTSDGRPHRTAVLQVQNRRQRVERGHGFVEITQCDLGRSLILNEAKRIYASVPFAGERGPRVAGTRVHVAPDTRPVSQTMFIDAVDTGERRQFGPLTARRVITTTTTERPGDAAPMRTQVQDGWYLDLLADACGENRGVAAAVLIGGPHATRTAVKWKRTARTGWPVIEADRMFAGTESFVVSTTIEEFSQARLDPALFEIPDGYRPALPLGAGGFDLERPDTLVNRIRAACESAAGWLQYQWSSVWPYR